MDIRNHASKPGFVEQAKEKIRLTREYARAAKRADPRGDDISINVDTEIRLTDGSSAVSRYFDEALSKVIRNRFHDLATAAWCEAEEMYARSLKEQKDKATVLIKEIEDAEAECFED